MKKKILLVINTLGHAGAEMAMIELIKSFDSRKYEISLYVLLEQGELLHKIPDHVILINKHYRDDLVLSSKGQKAMIKTIGRAALRRGTSILLLPYLIKEWFQMVKKGRVQKEKLLWRLLSDGGERLKETYDLAIAYLEGGATYYVADHVKAKNKVAFIHIDYNKAGYTRSLDKDCYLKFRKIFGVSQEVVDSFLKVYPQCKNRTGIFHNILDVEGIKRMSMEAGGFCDQYNGVRLLTVGRLVFQKGYDVAIDAMEIIKQRGFLVRWYILGEGTERKNLEAKIKEKGLEEDFILLGSNSNPYPYYRQADIYVHATRYEGKSIAVQEAQILGCAMIVSDCNGNREQIENGKDGILCDFNPSAIAESIILLIKDKELLEKFKNQSRQKRFQNESVTSRLLELLPKEE